MESWGSWYVQCVLCGLRCYVQDDIFHIKGPYMFYKCIVWHHNRTVASYIRDYRVIRESIWVVNRVKSFQTVLNNSKANKEGEEVDVGDVAEVTVDSGNDTWVFSVRLVVFCCFMSYNIALSSALERPLRSDTLFLTHC